MTDKLTAAQLRDLANLLNVFYDNIATGSTWTDFLRDEAARREAVETKRVQDWVCPARTSGECSDVDDCHRNDGCKDKPDAPPPPADGESVIKEPVIVPGVNEAADDLVKRLRRVNANEAPYANDLVLSWCHEAAAAIEALRAREKALEGALRAISANNITGDEFVTQGPALALKRLRICAGLADQALAAGGGNG